MGRYDDHFEAVDLLELVSLCVGRTGHTGQLAVHAEEVLEGDRGDRLVLFADLHVFLGLDRLMQAVRPAPTRHRAAGELVDNDDLAVLDDVLDVALVQRMRTQRRIEVVEQADVLRVIQAAAVAQQAGLRKQLLDALMPDLRQVHLLLLLVDPVIAADAVTVALLAGQRSHLDAKGRLDTARSRPLAGTGGPRRLDAEALHRAPAPDVELDGAAGGANGGGDVIGVGDRRAGNVDQHVAHDQAAGGRRAGHRGDQTADLGRFLARRLRQARHELVDGEIKLGAFLGRAGDDERRARFVDEDRVDFIDDGVLETPLDPILEAKRQVVAQIVEAVFVVGAVSDVTGIGRTLLFLRLAGADDADGHAQEAVGRCHPLGVAAGEVVVDGNDVGAAALERVEVDRQRRHQRLALAGPHFGDLALVQRHAADELHVEVPHPERAPCRLAHDRERLGQQVVKRFTLVQPGAELDRLLRQLLVRQRLQGRFEARRVGDAAVELPKQPLVATAEDLGKQLEHVVVLDSANGRRCGRGGPEFDADRSRPAPRPIGRRAGRSDHRCKAG